VLNATEERKDGNELLTEAIEHYGKARGAINKFVRTYGDKLPTITRAIVSNQPYYITNLIEQLRVILTGTSDSTQKGATQNADK